MWQPHLCQIYIQWGRVGQGLAPFGKCTWRTKLAHIWHHLGQTLPIPWQVWPIVTNTSIVQKLAHIWHHVGQIWATPCQVWPTFTKAPTHLNRPTSGRTWPISCQAWATSSNIPTVMNWPTSYAADVYKYGLWFYIQRSFVPVIISSSHQ